MKENEFKILFQHYKEKYQKKIIKNKKNGEEYIVNAVGYTSNKDEFDIKFAINHVENHSNVAIQDPSSAFLEKYFEVV